MRKGNTTDTRVESRDFKGLDNFLEIEVNHQ